MRENVAWFIVLSVMFFALYGFEAPRVASHFVDPNRVSFIEESAGFWMLGIVAALVTSAAVIAYKARSKRKD